MNDYIVRDLIIRELVDRLDLQNALLQGLLLALCHDKTDDWGNSIEDMVIAPYNKELERQKNR